MTKAKLLITHSASLTTALVAAKESGISQDRIVILDSKSNSPGSYTNVEKLVREGLARGLSFTERRLAPGEAKTKLALLSFSSGTTGRPKAVAIPHYSVIANTIQMATHGKLAEDYTTWEERRYRPGDAVYTGKVYLESQMAKSNETQITVLPLYRKTSSSFSMRGRND